MGDGQLTRPAHVVMDLTACAQVGQLCGPGADVTVRPLLRRAQHLSHTGLSEALRVPHAGASSGR